MSILDTLDQRYRVILCDIWGCVHDGVRLYPGAAARLAQWRREGRRIILITNAPRTAEAVSDQLRRLGLSDGHWDGVATSGEAGIAALNECAAPVGFIGTAADRAILEGRGVEIDDGSDFGELACTGLDEERRQVSDYEEQLRDLAGGGVRMHCLNPDRVVVRGGTPEPCAGALADRFLELGGAVEWYGKPYPAIYRHAMHLAGDPPREQVLAVGDALQTDVLGAARFGIDCIFVAGGIHEGEAFPDSFGAENGLPGWRPLAVVDSLG